MKNLTKNFVAVAALFVGFACTTDATEDLGAQVGGADQTTVTLSLEESRTALGAEVNHLYPVTWSADDAIMINGVTQLIMMKSDVLDGFETIKACVAYKVNNEEIDYFPYDITEGVEPIYAELPGWKTDMTQMTSEDEFPEEFNAYVTFLEEQLETPIKIISVGPDRAQTIERYTEE